MNNTTTQLFFQKIKFIFKRILPLFIIMMGTFFSQAQTATWTGNDDGTNWDVFGNWSFAGGGGFDKSTAFTIPSNATGPTTAFRPSIDIGSLNVESNATATVPSGFTINVDGSSLSEKGILNDGSLTNAGGIINVYDTAKDGIDNNGTFNNKAGGEINIDNSGGDGIDVGDGTFNNEGNINIGQITGNIDNIGIKNESNFDNSCEININNTGESGIHNMPTGIFTNSSIINIGTNGSPSNIKTFGIQNENIFNNKGSISADHTMNDGIRNTSGIFTNSATINIGLNGVVKKDGIDNNAGTFNNNGTINTENTESNGINSESPFYNKGTINIDNTGANGIAVEDDIFTNAATINIGTNGTLDNIVGHGISNTATFNNKNGGEINIDNTFLQGIANAGMFTNIDSINLGQNGGPGNMMRNGIDNEGGTFLNDGGVIDIDNALHDGIANMGPFTNIGGIIEIDNCGDLGILVKGTFTNEKWGQIAIGQNGGNISDQGMTVEAFTFINDAATLTIDETGSDGVQIVSNGTFDNLNGGEVLVGQNSGNIGGSAINVTSGAYNNGTCSTTKISNKLSNSATTTNDGLLVVNTSEAHANSGTMTNNGIIEYPQGNPIPNVTNNEVIVAPLAANDCQNVSPAFSLGNPVDFFIEGIYTDAGGNDSAGDYDDNNNTFIPDPPLSDGTHNLFVKIRDTGGNCTRIVSWKLTTEDCCSAPTVYAYTVIGKKEIKMKENTVQSGGVGIIKSGKKVILKKGTMVTAPNTFVRSPELELKGGSQVSEYYQEKVDKNILPMFQFGSSCGNDVKFDDNSGSHNLNQNCYGKIKVGKNVSITFTGNSTVKVKEIEMKQGSSIFFDQATDLLIKKEFKGGKEMFISNEGHEVWIFVKKEVKFEKNSDVQANVYALKKLKVKKETSMTGLFISKDKVDSKKNVTWNWYDSGCPPAVPLVRQPQPKYCCPQ